MNSNELVSNLLTILANAKKATNALDAVKETLGDNYNIIVDNINNTACRECAALLGVKVEQVEQVEQVKQVKQVKQVDNTLTSDEEVFKSAIQDNFYLRKSYDKEYQNYSCDAVSDAMIRYFCTEKELNKFKYNYAILSQTPKAIYNFFVEKVTKNDKKKITWFSTKQKYKYCNGKGSFIIKDNKEVITWVLTNVKSENGVSLPAVKIVKIKLPK